MSIMNLYIDYYLVQWFSCYAGLGCLFFFFFFFDFPKSNCGGKCNPKKTVALAI